MTRDREKGSRVTLRFSRAMPDAELSGEVLCRVRVPACLLEDRVQTAWAHSGPTAHTAVPRGTSCWVTFRPQAVACALSQDVGDPWGQSCVAAGDRAREHPLALGSQEGWKEGPELDQEGGGQQGEARLLQGGGLSRKCRGPGRKRRLMGETQAWEHRAEAHTAFNAT